MLKPLIAPTKVFNPISRGLMTAAKNSVGRVQESTQKITKGLSKDQKFPLNYVEFFGSKKTVKILRKNLKSVRDSLTGTFGIVDTVTKTVGGLVKKLGPGGIFGGIVGTIGTTIFGGILGKALLVTLAGLAIGGLGFLLARGANDFFKFLENRRKDFRPIVIDIIKDFISGGQVKTGLVDDTRDLDRSVANRADEIMSSAKSDGKTISSEDAYAQAVQEQLAEINSAIAEAENLAANAPAGQEKTLAKGAVQNLKAQRRFLLEGELETKGVGLGRFLGRRFFGIDTGQNFQRSTDYSTLSSTEKLSRLNRALDTTDIDKLKFQTMRSSGLDLSYGGSATGDRARFNIDLLNLIKSIEENKKFTEDNLLPNDTPVGDLVKENKKILQEFKEIFLKNINTPTKKSKVNIINSGQKQNVTSGGEGEKLVSAEASSSFLGMDFSSALNPDLAMERGTSSLIYGNFMSGV